MELPGTIVAALMCFACSCTLQSRGVLEPLRLQNAMSWLHECCMGPALGWMPDHCVFSCKVPYAGDEGYLVCARGEGRSF